MNKLKAMEVFIRVAEAGNLSAAARSLGLTQPAVSQQVMALEQSLGVALLLRTTRSVTLTEPGERYYQQIRPILDALTETEETLLEQQQKLSGTLRVQAPTGIGQHLLTPIVVAFQQRNPQLSVELTLEDRLADVVSEGVDLAIRLGEPAGLSQVVRRLANVQRVLVAAPHYLQQAGTPARLSELAQHRTLRYSGLAAGDELTLEGAGGKESVRLNPVFRANNSFSLIAALEAGGRDWRHTAAAGGQAAGAGNAGPGAAGVPLAAARAVCALSYPTLYPAEGADAHRGHYQRDEQRQRNNNAPVPGPSRKIAG